MLQFIVFILDIYLIFRKYKLYILHTVLQFISKIIHPIYILQIYKNGTFWYVPTQNGMHIIKIKVPNKKIAEICWRIHFMPEINYDIIKTELNSICNTIEYIDSQGVYKLITFDFIEDTYTINAVQNDIIFNSIYF